MAKLVKIVVAAGKNAGKEYPLGERTFIGADPKSDIVIAGVAKSALSIEKIEELYLLKSLTDSGVTISGEGPVFEKILISGERIRLGETELEFRDEVAKIGLGLAKKNKNLLTSTIFVLALLLVIVVFYYNLPNIKKTGARKIQEPPIKKMVTKENSVSKPDATDIAQAIKEAEYKFKVAEHYYQEGRLDSGNFYRALIVWKEIVKSLEDINPQPPIYQRAKDRLNETQKELDARIKYLKNNAFVAYKSGQLDYSKSILKRVMRLVPEPTDGNYIWVKRKLMDMKEGI